MKKILVISVLFLVMGCEKEIPKKDVVTNPNDVYGVMHNEILELYYSKNNMMKSVSVDEKMKIVDEYLIKKGYSFTFSKLVTPNSSYKKTANLLNNYEMGFSDTYDLLETIYTAQEISFNEYSFSKDLLQVMQDNVGNSDKVLYYIRELEQSIVSNKNYSSEEVNKFYLVLSITKHSIEYWKSVEIGANSKGMPWYVKDSVGAMTGMSTGLVGYATLLGGPIGGSLALLGSAALSSMI